VGETLDELGVLAELGVQVAHGRVEGVQDIRPLEVIGQQLVPAVATW
jgi:hypothetical protein